MPQVSLNFSAASLAMASDGPRPRTKSELALSERSASLASSRSRRPCEMLRQSAKGGAAAPSSSVPCARSARPATTELTKDLVAATLFSGPAAMSIAWSRRRRQRRVGGVGERDRQRAAVARRLGHGDDVGALAGLRDGEAGRAVRASASRRRSRRATDRARRPECRRSARSHISGKTRHGRTSRARRSPGSADRGSRMPAPGCGDRASDASRSRAAASGISSISRRMWVVVRVIAASASSAARRAAVRRRNHRRRRDRSSG